MLNSTIGGKLNDNEAVSSSSSSSSSSDENNNRDNTKTTTNTTTTKEDLICRQLETSLDELQSKIEIKRRLIGELETNTKSLEVMRMHYEEKMSILHERIKQIEDERDRVILNMSNITQLSII